MENGKKILIYPDTKAPRKLFIFSFLFVALCNILFLTSTFSLQIICDDDDDDVDISR
jgi:hypothetical protein